MAPFVRTYRDWRLLSHHRLRHVRELRGPLLRWGLWYDARALLLNTLTLPFTVAYLALMLPAYLLQQAGRSVLPFGVGVRNALAFFLGLQGDGEWYWDLQRRMPSKHRRVPKAKGGIHVCDFICDGDHVTSRTGDPVDVSPFLTCTDAGDDILPELRVVWAAYACADDADLADDARRIKGQLLALFHVEHAQ